MQIHLVQSRWTVFFFLLPYDFMHWIRFCGDFFFFSLLFRFKLNRKSVYEMMSYSKWKWRRNYCIKCDTAVTPRTRLMGHHRNWQFHWPVLLFANSRRLRWLLICHAFRWVWSRKKKMPYPLVQRDEFSGSSNNLSSMKYENSLIFSLN